MINEQIATSLANEIVAYIKLKRDKKEESYLKDKPKKNKQGVITNGAINARLITLAKQHSNEKETIAEIEKAKKSKEQSVFEFQVEKYERLIELFPENEVNTELQDLKSEYLEFKASNNQEHEPVTWLTEWAPKAKDISFATHVAKLTHSSSKGSSVLDATKERNEKHLTTNSINNPEIDTASSNAASLPIADILKISVKGQSILDCLKNNDTQVFNKLVDDDFMAKQWFEQLNQAYDSSTKTSYFLSKQTYFPIADKKYHLLLPLKSSSLIHALHIEHQKYYADDQTNIRKQRSNKKYSPNTLCYYPNKAKLHVTGSNHSNASSLNGKRGGVITLLSCAPPSKWRGKVISYQTRDSIFGKSLIYALREEITELKNYLKLLKSKTLSISEPKRNAAVLRKLNNINSALFDYAMLITRSENLKNWTMDSILPIEQQLLFEPWRDDEVASNTKLNNKWQKDLSNSFGVWLQRQLEGKSGSRKSLIHQELWATIFANDLREFIATQEVSL